MPAKYSNWLKKLGPADGTFFIMLNRKCDFCFLEDVLTVRNGDFITPYDIEEDVISGITRVYDDDKEILFSFEYDNELTEEEQKQFRIYEELRQFLGTDEPFKRIEKPGMLTRLFPSGTSDIYFCNHGTSMIHADKHLLKPGDYICWNWNRSKPFKGNIRKMVADPIPFPISLSDFLKKPTSM